jgi:hypothetical protein
MGPTWRGNEILEMGPTKRGNEIPAFKSPASPDMKKNASVLRAAKRNTSSKNEIPELRPE